MSIPRPFDGFISPSESGAYSLALSQGVSPTKVQTGPEAPLFFEKIVALLRLPYSWGCVVLAVALGPPGFFLAAFLDSFNLDQAIQKTFFANPLGVGSLQPWQFAYSDAVFTGLTFYAYYVIRYMRLRLLRSEAEIVPLLPHGEETFHSAFRLVSRNLPVALLTVIVALSSVPYTLGRVQSSVGFFWLAINMVALSLSSLGFATFIWVFFGSLKGLYNIGNQQLKLKSHFEDTLFGVRPLGTLSLNLAFLFFVGLGLVILGVLFSPDITSIVGLASFAIPGIAFFFLPLSSIHKRMTEAKQRELRWVRTQLAEILSNNREARGDNDNATMADLEKGLSELKRVQALEIAGKEVSTLRTWPFDTQILGRLTVIILSTTAALIARIIIVFAKL